MDCKATCEDVLKQPGRLWPEKYFQEKRNKNNLVSLSATHLTYKPGCVQGRRQIFI